MSRIYFHSPTRTSELHGSERGYAAFLTRRVALSALEFEGFGDPVRQMVESGVVPSQAFVSFSPISPAGAFARWLDGFLDSPFFLIEGERVPAGETALNTAQVLGSDAIALLARLHGSCEDHLFVEGPDRTWLAQIIDAGRISGVLRASAGWEEVAEHLREREDEPVVTSYSVGQSFPHAQYVYDEEGEEEMRIGDDESDWVQWMAQIRSHWWLQLSPQNLHTPCYRGRKTLLDVQREVDRLT